MPTPIPSIFKRIFCLVLSTSLITPSFNIPLIHAQEIVLPVPGTMIHLSQPFIPPVLKGIKVHPDNPLQFDFILDKGDLHLADDEFKQECTKLIKYFLTSLTTPEKDLWVNLSPYEHNRIIPNSFGLTEMGRDLLAEDYMLKQITASLIYPEDELGKKFWKRIYEDAHKKFGTTNIPVNTFNKVWIVPEKAVIYENAHAGTAYVADSKLKVLLEEDYLALNKSNTPTGTVKSSDTASLGSQIIREVIIPQLEKEINTGQNFSVLRQVYHSLILATWYKRKIKGSILSEVYADKNKIAGITTNDPQQKEIIYQQYLQAFKKGVYNFIKEEQDFRTNKIIPRKYFSGGASFDAASLSHALHFTNKEAIVSDAQLDNAVIVESLFQPFHSPQSSNDGDMAMVDEETTDDENIGLEKIKESLLKAFDQRKPEELKLASLPARQRWTRTETGFRLNKPSGMVVGYHIGHEEGDEEFKRGLMAFGEWFKERLPSSLRNKIAFNNPLNYHITVTDIVSLDTADKKRLQPKLQQRIQNFMAHLPTQFRQTVDAEVVGIDMFINKDGTPGALKFKVKIGKHEKKVLHDFARTFWNDLNSDAEIKEFIFPHILTQPEEMTFHITLGQLYDPLTPDEIDSLVNAMKVSAEKVRHIKYKQPMGKLCGYSNNDPFFYLNSNNSLQLYASPKEAGSEPFVQQAFQGLHILKEVDVNEPKAEKMPSISFKTSLNSIYKVFPSPYLVFQQEGAFSTQRNKTLHPFHPRDDIGQKKMSAVTYFVKESTEAQRIGMHGTVSGRKAVYKVGNKAYLVGWNNKENKWGMTEMDRSNPIELSIQPQQEYFPIELFHPEFNVNGTVFFNNWHAGNSIVEISNDSAQITTFNKEIQEIIRLRVKQMSNMTGTKGGQFWLAHFLETAVLDFTGAGIVKDQTDSDEVDRFLLKGKMLWEKIQAHPEMHATFKEYLKNYVVQISDLDRHMPFFIAATNFLANRPLQDRTILGEVPDLQQETHFLKHHPWYGKDTVAILPNTRTNLPVEQKKKIKILLVGVGERFGENQKTRYLLGMLRKVLGAGTVIEIVGTDIKYQPDIYTYDEVQDKFIHHRIFDFNEKHEWIDPETGVIFRKVDLNNPKENLVSAPAEYDATQKFDVIINTRVAIQYSNDPVALANMLKNCQKHLAPSGLLLFDPPHMEEVEMYFNDPLKGIVDAGFMPFRFEEQIQIDLNQMFDVLGFHSKTIERAYRLALKYVGPGIRDLQYKRTLFHGLAQTVTDPDYLSAILLMGIEPEYISDAFSGGSVETILKYRSELLIHGHFQPEQISQVISKPDKQTVINIKGKPTVRKDRLELRQAFHSERVLFDDGKRSVILGQVGTHNVLKIEDKSAQQVVYLFDSAMLDLDHMENENSVPGGIDFNSDKMNLQQITNDDGAIKFNIDPAMLQQLQFTPGFVPIIIRIRPLNNLPTFLNKPGTH